MSTVDPMSNNLSDAEVATIRRNQCPACKNWGFIAGPRGGAGQNIFCANPACRARFMVAPPHNNAMAMRVGEADESYYPPKVHILSTGRPLCNFAGSVTIERGPPTRIVPTTPDLWPVGHSWVGREDFELSNCPACRTRARS